ncbi:MAG: DUF3617 domain-containing protein [Geminicoccaceae bacterium]
MKVRSTAWATLVTISLCSPVLAETTRLEDGLYEVQFRLELPHLETHAVDRTATICIDQGKPERHHLPIPLLSQNDIFADCEIENIENAQNGFSYDITCTGRGSARATATYVTTPNHFKSRIAIIQGAKNMTMTEVQKGRRLGDCRARAIRP